MAKRRFELPGIQDLSKQQEAARALPKEGQHLIVGGPGTGKTVLALIRACRHARDGDPHVFLVHNHLLHLSSGQLACKTLTSATWESWFAETFRELTGQPLPRENTDTPGAYEPINWTAVLDHVKMVTSARDAPYLVIDEGQDMPPEFYRSLVNLGFERLFVAADQNQQITDAHSSRKDIETELDIEPKDVIELTHNYRNSTPVAKLARAFYTGDPASPPPGLPERGGVPAWLLDYPPESIGEICHRILLLSDRDPTRLIGVLAPNNHIRQRYLDGLCAAGTDTLDHDPPIIETFFGIHRPEVRFDEGGILVINCQACKGLEFDIAVLADIDQHYFRPDDREATMKLFYVMVARAREQVVLLRQSGVDSRIDEILPQDRNVLRRTFLTRKETS